MATSTIADTGPSEVTILVNEQVELPREVARYLLTLQFSEDDKTRMQDLVVRNQQDLLSLAEKDELFAYSKAGNFLSILKSKARRALRGKPRKRLPS
jgi:hypothetical protein